MMSSSASTISRAELTDAVYPGIDIKYETNYEPEQDEEIDLDQIAYDPSEVVSTCLLGDDQDNRVIDESSEIVMKVEPGQFIQLENEMYALNQARRTVPPLRLRVKKRTRNSPDSDPEYTYTESGRKKRAKRSTKPKAKEKAGRRKPQAMKNLKPIRRRRVKSPIPGDKSEKRKTIDHELTNWEPLVMPKRLNPVFKCCVRMTRSSDSEISKFTKIKISSQNRRKQAENVKSVSPAVSDGELSDFNPGNLFPDHNVSDDDNEYFEEGQPNDTSLAHPITTNIRRSKSGQMLTCLKCYKTFTRPTGLAYHMKAIHSSEPLEREFGCDVCGNSFHTRDHLNKHKKVHEDQDQPWSQKRSTSNKRRSGTKTAAGASRQMSTCVQCDKSFTRPAGLAYHMKAMHADEPVEREFVCDECGKSYRRKDHLAEHQKEVHDGQGTSSSIRPKNQCEFCQRVFTRPFGLTYHQKQEPSSPPLTCKVCPQSFKLANCLNYHIQACHPEVTSMVKIVSGVKRSDTGVFNCDKCGKGFTRPYGLAYHIKIVHLKEKIERKFICDVCGKSFLQKGHLREHRRTHPIDGKSKPERDFACPHCDKTFIWKPQLTQHLRIHTGEQFQCRHCPAESKTTYQRAVHEKLEHGILSCVAAKRKSRPRNKNRRLNCSYLGCEKFFHSLQTWKIHERTHTGEKPFLCSDCGNAYKSAHSLKEHTNSVHTGLKPYPCPEQSCGERFARRLNLKYHVAMKHDTLASKQFPCEFCTMKFFTRFMLIRHRRKHTGEKPFACHMCTARYKQMRSLTLHLNSCGRTIGVVNKTKVVKIAAKKPSKPRIRKRVPNKNADKIYPCSFCSKMFTRLGDAKRHEGIHTDDNPYKCTTCQKSFRTNYRLQAHKKIHDNEMTARELRKLECPNCPKKFTTRGTLKTHIRDKHYGHTVPTDIMDTMSQYTPAGTIPTFPSTSHHSPATLTEPYCRIQEPEPYYPHY